MHFSSTKRKLKKTTDNLAIMLSEKQRRKALLSEGVIVTSLGLILRYHCQRSTENEEVGQNKEKGKIPDNLCGSES